MVTKYRVTKAYKSPYERTIRFRKGEILRFERRKTEWSGWLWCTSGSGECAWVPEAWVELGAATCVMTRDYTARELSVQEGEEVRATLAESGWVWASTPSGGEGWVPLECLEEE